MDPNALSTLAATLAAFTLVEAAVAVVSVVAVAEAPAIASGIATALAVGGFAGGVATISLVGIAVVGIVAITIGAVTIVVAAQAVSRQLASRPPTTPTTQSGEQTDFSVPTVPPLVVRFSVDTVGNVTATQGVGAVDLGNINVPGQSNVSFTPSLEINLTPAPVATDLIDIPGTTPNPGDIFGDPSDTGSMGMMMAVAEPSRGIPFPSSLILLLLGVAATTRRLFR